MLNFFSCMALSCSPPLPPPISIDMLPSTLNKPFTDRPILSERVQDFTVMLGHTGRFWGRIWTMLGHFWGRPAVTPKQRAPWNRSNVPVNISGFALEFWAAFDLNIGLSKPLYYYAHFLPFHLNYQLHLTPAFFFFFFFFFFKDE